MVDKLTSWQVDK